jgi:hypothetical protein
MKERRCTMTRRVPSNTAGILAAAFARLCALALAVSAGVATSLTASSTALGAASLTVELITWDVIGLDSNSPADGPDTFPVGVRVCNGGDSDAAGVRADFVWDSNNAHIALEDLPYIEIGSIAAATCQDVYFNVVVQKVSAAFGTTRAYHIEIRGDGVATVSTSQPRELYVESLVSQERNHVDAITGPGGTPPATTVHVGNIYSYELHGGTATNGYEQLEVFLSFPNAIFRVLSVGAVYTGPAGGTNDSVYADACGWDALPTSATYLSCVGPEMWSSGKAGGDIVITYRVLVVATGEGTIDGLIHDFSGSSFHYNADIGEDSIIITSLLDQSTTTTAAPATSTSTTLATPMTLPTVFRGVETTLPTPTTDLPETGLGRSSLTIGIIAMLLVTAGVLLRRASTVRAR